MLHAVRHEGLRLSGLRVTAEADLVALEGELDLFSCEPVRQELHRLYKTSSPRVTVDVSKLKYIDSVGVEVLLTAQSRLRSQERELLISGAEGQVLKMFSLLRLLV